MEETKVESTRSDDDDVVKAGESAINFLQNIDQEELLMCIFKDDLVTVSEDGKSIGEFVASVEKATKSGEICFLVHASSQGKVEDIPMGTSLQTYLNSKDLSLVYQEHYEYVRVPGHELEKRTEMDIDRETGQLTVKRQVTQGDEIRKSTHRFPKEHLIGFITEGSNLLLQRLLVRCGIHEEMDFVTLDSESGHIVPMTYKPLPERKQQVGKKELTVSGIERCVVSNADLPYTWQSYFMEDGHLTMRVQVGSPAIVTLEKVPRMVEREESEEKPIFGKQPLVWEQDMEMNSRFLQRKEELVAGHERYLREHPEATALLADFFQFLLLRRPRDVVGFAADFFSTFSNSLPEASPYKHSANEAETEPLSNQ
ncbi:ciliogenesis-associated TTC17-interacting protein-like [Clavelina lepadiformis]|uniref:ciliogenesis-associated TTC17-interacting protein-like n=1 Tax=Clavelina lepadiformis TaxID=159417 RepID=UPI004042BE27